MEKYFQHVHDELIGSGASQEDFVYFVEVLSLLDEPDQMSLLELCMTDSRWIIKINNLIQGKRDVLRSLDASAWKKLIAEEELALESLER